MPTYYYGMEGKAEWGYETQAAYATAVTPSEAVSWLRSATLSINENISREYYIGQSTFRKADAAIKGNFEVTGTLTFWLPDDLDATTLDVWILKLPLDAFNEEYCTTGSKWIIPNVVTSAYGSFVLPSFTMEIGHSKSGNVRNHVLLGCVADSFTMRARSGDRIECTMDFIAKDCQSNSTVFSGSTSRSTKPPLGWEHVVMGYADDGTETARTDFTAFEFTVSNNLKPNYDLSSTYPRRCLTNIIPERQDLSGSATVNMTTTAGMTLYDDLLGTTTVPYRAKESVVNKQFNFDIRNSASGSTEAIEYTFRNVVIGEIPLDIDPTKLQEITFPWTAQYYQLEIITADTAGPTNWDDQS